MDFPNHKLQSVFTNVFVSENTQLFSEIKACASSKINSVYTTNTKSASAYSVNDGELTETENQALCETHVCISSSLTESATNDQINSITLLEDFIPSSSNFEDEAFKKVLDKLYIAYQDLSPIIDEIIGWSDLTEQASENASSSTCSVTQEHLEAAVKASKILQEIDNQVTLNAGYNTEILKVADYVVNTVHKILYTNVVDNGLEEPKDKKIFIEKHVVNQLVELYNMLHGSIKQLYQIAKRKQMTAYCKLEDSHLLKPSEELNVVEYSEQTDTLAKLQEEYQGLSDTVNMLKSIIQETPGSVADIRRLGKSMHDARKSKSDNSVVTETEKSKKVTDIGGARRCILECLVELAQVRKYLKSVDNAEELDMVNQIRMSGPPSRKECCSRRDIPHLHAKLNGIPIVVKLNQETLDSNILNEENSGFLENINQIVHTSCVASTSTPIIKPSGQSTKMISTDESELPTKVRQVNRRNQNVTTTKSMLSLRSSKSYSCVNEKPANSKNKTLTKRSRNSSSNHLIPTSHRSLTKNNSSRGDSSKRSNFIEKVDLEYTSPSSAHINEKTFEKLKVAAIQPRMKSLKKRSLSYRKISKFKDGYYTLKYSKSGKLLEMTCRIKSNCNELFKKQAILIRLESLTTTSADANKTNDKLMQNECRIITPEKYKRKVSSNSMSGGDSSYTSSKTNEDVAEQSSNIVQSHLEASAAIIRETSVASEKSLVIIDSGGNRPNYTKGSPPSRDSSHKSIEFLFKRIGSSESSLDGTNKNKHLECITLSPKDSTKFADERNTLSTVRMFNKWFRKECGSNDLTPITDVDEEQSEGGSVTTIKTKDFGTNPNKDKILTSENIVQTSSILRTSFNTSTPTPTPTTATATTTTKDSRSTTSTEFSSDTSILQKGSFSKKCDRVKSNLSIQDKYKNRPELVNEEKDLILAQMQPYWPLQNKTSSTKLIFKQKQHLMDHSNSASKTSSESTTKTYNAAKIKLLIRRRDKYYKSAGDSKMMTPMKKISNSSISVTETDSEPSIPYGISVCSIPPNETSTRKETIKKQYRQVKFIGSPSVHSITNDSGTNSKSCVSIPYPVSLVSLPALFEDNTKANKTTKENIRKDVKYKSYYSKSDYYSNMKTNFEATEMKYLELKNNLETKDNKNINRPLPVGIIPSDLTGYSNFVPPCGQQTFEVRVFEFQRGAPKEPSPSVTPTSTSERRGSRFYSYPDVADFALPITSERRESIDRAPTPIAVLPPPALGPYLATQPWAPFVTSDVSLPRLREGERYSSREEQPPKEISHSVKSVETDKIIENRGVDPIVIPTTTWHDAAQETLPVIIQYAPKIEDVGVQTIQGGLKSNQNQNEPRTSQNALKANQGGVKSGQGKLKSGQDENKTKEDEITVPVALLKHFTFIPDACFYNVPCNKSSKVCGTNTCVDFQLPQKGPRATLDVSTSYHDQVIHADRKMECSVSPKATPINVSQEFSSCFSRGKEASISEQTGVAGSPFYNKPKQGTQAECNCGYRIADCACKNKQEGNAAGSNRSRAIQDSTTNYRGCSGSCNSNKNSNQVPSQREKDSINKNKNPQVMYYFNDQTNCPFKNKHQYEINCDNNYQDHCLYNFGSVTNVKSLNKFFPEMQSSSPKFNLHLDNPPTRSRQYCINSQVDIRTKPSVQNHNTAQGDQIEKSPNKNLCFLCIPNELKASNKNVDDNTDSDIVRENFIEYSGNHQSSRKHVYENTLLNYQQTQNVINSNTSNYEDFKFMSSTIPCVSQESLVTNRRSSTSAINQDSTFYKFQMSPRSFTDKYLANKQKKEKEAASHTPAMHNKESITKLQEEMEFKPRFSLNSFQKQNKINSGQNAFEVEKSRIQEKKSLLCSYTVGTNTEFLSNDYVLTGEPTNQSKTKSAEDEISNGEFLRCWTSMDDGKTDFNLKSTFPTTKSSTVTVLDMRNTEDENFQGRYSHSNMENAYQNCPFVYEAFTKHGTEKPPTFRRRLENAIAGISKVKNRKLPLEGNRTTAVKKVSVSNRIEKKKPRKSNSRMDRVLQSQVCIGSTHIMGSSMKLENRWRALDTYRIIISHLSDACTQSVNLKSVKGHNLTKPSLTSEQRPSDIKRASKGSNKKHFLSDHYHYDSEFVPNSCNKCTQSPPVTYRSKSNKQQIKSVPIVLLPACVTDSATNYKHQHDNNNNNNNNGENSIQKDRLADLFNNSKNVTWRKLAEKSQCEKEKQKEEQHLYHFPPPVVDSVCKNQKKKESKEISSGIDLVVNDAYKAILKVRSAISTSTPISSNDYYNDSDEKCNQNPYEYKSRIAMPILVENKDVNYNNNNNIYWLHSHSDLAARDSIPLKVTEDSLVTYEKLLSIRRENLQLACDAKNNIQTGFHPKENNIRKGIPFMPIKLSSSQPLRSANQSVDLIAQRTTSNNQVDANYNNNNQSQLKYPISLHGTLYAESSQQKLHYDTTKADYQFCKGFASIKIPAMNSETSSSDATCNCTVADFCLSNGKACIPIESSINHQKRTTCNCVKGGFCCCKNLCMCNDYTKQKISEELHRKEKNHIARQTIPKETNNVTDQDKICWALTRVKTRNDGSKNFEILETSPISPGQFIIPTNSVIVLGNQTYIGGKEKRLH